MEEARPTLFYEFGEICFYPSDGRLFTKDGRSYHLPPKQGAMLLTLVQKAGAVVTYDELRNHVWGDVFRASDQTIRETKRSLSSLLTELDKTSSTIIETVPRQGYRFSIAVAVVNKHDSPSRPNDTVDYARHFQQKSNETVVKVALNEIPLLKGIPDNPYVRRETTQSNYTQSFRNPIYFMISSCFSYALIYTVAFFLEIAYQFDRFAGSAFKIAPLVFLGIFFSSYVGLLIDLKTTLHGKPRGLLFSLLVFTGASIFLYFCLVPFLPDVPITEARFQTYTAQGAYLKNIGYFLSLAIVFMVLPLHFVASMQKEFNEGNYRTTLDCLLGKETGAPPQGTIYLKGSWLVALLVIALIMSIISTTHLVDNLTSNPNMNLFLQLIQVRLLLYFALAIGCVVWYKLSLDEIKRHCLSALSE